MENEQKQLAPRSTETPIAQFLKKVIEHADNIPGMRVLEYSLTGRDKEAWRLSLDKEDATITLRLYWNKPSPELEEIWLKERGQDSGF